MNIPSLSDLKSKIMSKVTDSITDKVLENFGGNPLGQDFSTVKKMFSGFDLESFNKLSMEEKISKGLVLGGAGVAGAGLLGLIGKSAGIDFLSDFSSNTFPIILGVGALAAIAGLAIPMYEKYKANEASREAGGTQLLDKNGVVLQDSSVAALPSHKLSGDVVSSKLQTLDSQFNAPSLDKPSISRLPMPRLA